MKINIKYNPYLDEVFKTHCLTLPKFAKWTQPTQESIDEKVEQYKKIWNPIESLVVGAIEQKTGKKFAYSLIDVAVVSACHRVYSSPIVIASYLSPEQFVTRVAHELIHKSGYGWNKDFIIKFGDKPKPVKNHIIIHALLEYIYRDVLNKPELLDVDKESARKNSTDEYVQAWNIVEEIGYNKILDSFIK